MKKSIAILLSLLMILSLPLASSAAAADKAFDIGAFASKVTADIGNAGAFKGFAKMAAGFLGTLTERLENAKISYDDLQNAVDEHSKIVMNVYGDGAAALPAINVSGASSTSLKAMSRQMSKYLFIKLDGPEDVAELIAESCEFSYVLLDGGNGTVYIRVDVENNPQIFNDAVFRNLVEDLYAKQGEVMIENGDGSTDYLMSYEHIAGELALHALLFAATKDVIKLTGTNDERILSLYNSAAVADLNVDESRISPQFIAFVGKLLMNVVTYGIMKAFGMA